jgi:class 3 adenylate cyclase/tetratricopeptide (TPR) repeat protein
MRDDHQSMSSAWGTHVPEYVIEQLRDHPDGAPIADAAPTEAVVLFADVAGFTSMSEALARSGHYGTEELSAILNSWFDAMNTLVARYGGSVTEFAGDALCAVFRTTARTRPATVRRAVQCALDMQADMAQFQPVRTRTGSYRLEMKVGVAAGRLMQTVMGDPAVRLGYVLAGPALARAVTAERHARGDEVVLDDGLLEPAHGDDLVTRDGRWWLVSRLRRRAAPVRSPTPRALGEDVAARLAPFLHPAIAERLRLGRRELVNGHRKVTAVFVALPEVVIDDPAALAALQRYLAAAVRLIARYDGHFRHLAYGDGESVLVALFGAPVSHEDDEERAVRCALELLRLPGGPYRAGLSTGAVYCGEVGADTRREYAVIGDSVNLAARLMQVATDDRLLMDSATREGAHDSTVHDRLTPVTVKGKSGPIDVWAVRALRERAAPAHDAAPAQRLVGREAEVARGRALLDRAREGAGQVLTIIGEAGIGKSRLAAEIIRMAQDGGFAVFRGSAQALGTNTSYLAWRPVWHDLLELDPTLPLAQLQAQLVDRIARHVADAGQRAPLLAPVLNVPMPDSELITLLDPQSRDRLLRGLLRRCLRDLAAARPLLLLIEDSHWIDPASAALLEFLAGSVGDRPVLILVTARTSVAEAPTFPGLAQLGHASTLALTELPRPDVERLVLMRLRERSPADAPFHPAVLDRIAEQGAGNPFYLGELVTYLHTHGIDVSDAQSLAGLWLPESLQRLLMARLDQLSEGAQATIKVASVIGRRFRASWISTIYPGAGDAQDVSRHLERLDALDLVALHGTEPEREYQFKHGLTEEAAYQSLTFRMRESLHERIGLLVETVLADRLPQYVDVLAHHFGRTQRADKQRVWFRAAGDAAKAAFANQAAVDYYRRLLPLLPLDQTGEVLVELGGVWQLTGSWAEAEGAYRDAMEVARAAGRPEILAAGQRDLGDLFMYNRSYAQAVTLLERAADGFERIGDAAGLSRTLDRVTFALYQQGAYDEALAAAERHRALCAETDDLAGLSIALNHIGLVHLDASRFDDAVTLIGEALETATAAGDRRCILHAATNLALVHLRRGDHPAAIEESRRAFAVAQEIGDRQIAGVVVGNMGEVYRDEGDYARARRCFAFGLRIGIELRDWTSIADQVANLAATWAAQGEDRQAEDLFDQAIALARRLDAPYLLCGWLHQLAKVHEQQGRFATAERLNREALEIADAHGERDVRVRASVLAQHVGVMLGRVRADEAVEALRALEDTWTEPHERALLLAAQWRYDPTDDTVRTAAAELYRHLYERTPNVEYRATYALLTGTHLPTSPPLPALPAGLNAADSDVDELVGQVATIAADVATAAPAESAGAHRIDAPELA